METEDWNPDDEPRHDDAGDAVTPPPHEAPADGTTAETQAQPLGAEDTNVHPSDLPKQGEEGYVAPDEAPAEEEETPAA